VDEAKESIDPAAVVRWTARVWTVFLAILLLSNLGMATSVAPVLSSEVPSPHLNPLWVVAMLSLCIGWRYEALGGSIAVFASFLLATQWPEARTANALVYGLSQVVIRGLPVEQGLAAFMGTPGLFYVASWVLRKTAVRNTDEASQKAA
jgi:hypothetical protein